MDKKKTERSKTGKIGFLFVVSIAILAGCAYLFTKHLRMQEYLDKMDAYAEAMDYVNLLSACDAVMELDSDNERAETLKKQAVQSAVKVLLNEGNIEEAESVITRHQQIVDNGTFNQLWSEIQSKKEIIGIQKKTMKESWYTVEEYDRTGHLTKSSIYLNDNTLWKYTEYRYDSFGNVVSEKNYSEVNVLTSDIKYEYVYDIAGNILQETYEDMTNLNKTVTTYEYDSVSGKRLREKNGDSTTEYQYWQDGTLRQITKKNGSIKELYEYSENGILLKQATYVNDTEELLSESVYNGNGDIEAYYSYDAGQVVEKMEYLYNAEGILTNAEFITGRNHITKWTYEYEYDTKGRLTKENIYWSENEQEPYLNLWTAYEYWDE